MGSQVRRNGQPVFRLRPAGAIEFLEAAYKFLKVQYPKFHKMDNLSKLGFLGTEFLLNEQFRNDPPLDEHTAVVLSNANSSLDTDIRYFATIAEIPSPALFVYTLPNIVIGEICIRNGFKGENAFFVFNTFDATFMDLYVNNLLNMHRIKACICGWVDFLEEEYQAVLFLVENEKRHESIEFSAENINKIYEKEHG
jgi:hypothetical protein